MKQWYDLGLETGLQIDQYIATRNQVEPREWRVANDAVSREDAHVAQFFDDAICPGFVDKEAPEPLGRDFLDHARRIPCPPRDTHRNFVDVGAKDLDLWRRRGFLQMLAQQDRDRINLLAGRATGDPDAHFVIRTFVLEQLWDDQCLERLKSRSIAKEIGHADQQVAKQRTDLVGLGLQTLGVIIELGRLDDLHSALDTPLKCSLFVFAEIVPSTRAQHVQDCG